MRKIFLAILLAGFLAYAGLNLSESVTPYVGIAEATSTTKNVQVKGLANKNFVPQQVGDESAVGKYNSQNSAFHAKNY